MSINVPADARQPYCVASPSSLEILIAVSAQQQTRARAFAESITFALGIYEREDLHGHRLLYLALPLDRHATQTEEAKVVMFVLDLLGIGNSDHQELLVRRFRAAETLVNVPGPVLDVDHALAHVAPVEVINRPMGRA